MNSICLLVHVNYGFPFKVSQSFPIQQFYAAMIYCIRYVNDMDSLSWGPDPWLLFFYSNCKSGEGSLLFKCRPFKHEAKIQRYAKIHIRKAQYYGLKSYWSDLDFALDVSVPRVSKIGFPKMFLNAIHFFEMELFLSYYWSRIFK